MRRLRPRSAQTCRPDTVPAHVLRGGSAGLRVIPVLLWSFSAITLGTALGGGNESAGGDASGV